MPDFKQQFGLDYLWKNAEASRSGQPGASDPAPSLPKGLGDAIFLYGNKVLGALNDHPGKTLRLFEIARRVSTRVDTLLPVMRLLTAEGYVEKTSEDPVGDDEFKLTNSGKNVAAG